MAQYLRPDEDISVGVWSSSPLYAKIDESTANDSDSISTYNAGVAETCIVGLSDGSDPSGEGHHLRFRHKCSLATPSRTLTAYLRQGTTVIASKAVTPTRAGWVTDTLTLSSAQIANITDYTDLNIQFTCSAATSNTVSVSWAEFEIPDAATGRVFGPAIQMH